MHTHTHTNTHTSLSGIHALAAVIYSTTGDGSKSSHQVSQLLGYLRVSLDNSAADEILYGRAGYLFSLLFVKNHIGKELLEGTGVESAMRKVFDAIVESGKKNIYTKPSGVQLHAVTMMPGTDKG